MLEQAAQPQPTKSSSSGNKTLVIVIIVVVVLAALGGVGYYLQQRTSEIVGEEVAEKIIEEATDGEADVDVSEGGGKVTIETDEGKTTITQNEIPKNFPSDITIYSGAEVSGASEYESGSTVALKTSDSTSKVFNYYKSDLAKNGWTTTFSTTSEEVSSISAEKGNKHLFLSVGKNEDDGKTDIAIIVTIEK